MNRKLLRYKARQLYGRTVFALTSMSICKKTIKESNVKVEKTAVIIHLFYPEMWNYIAKKIELIPEPYDIFITTTYQKQDLVKKVTTGYDVTIVACENRGRDVLPFLKCLNMIKDLGYSNVLKLHSKKSPHRTDGDRWANSMIASLLPSKRVICDSLNILKRNNTGIIGPANEYLKLSVNFEANGAHLEYIIRRAYSGVVARSTLHTNRSDYGFFAGSMFWARYDTLALLLKNGFYSESYYEREASQIDGTFAHALERAFSLLPEIEGREMYEMDNRRVKRINFASGSVPDWSDVYAGP